MDIQIEILNPWEPDKKYWKTEISRALESKSLGMLDNSIEANITIHKTKFHSFQIVDFYTKLHLWMKKCENDFKYYCDDYDESESVIIKFEKQNNKQSWRLTSEVETFDIQMCDSYFEEFLIDFITQIEITLKNELDIDILTFS